MKTTYEVSANFKVEADSAEDAEDIIETFIEEATQLNDGEATSIAFDCIMSVMEADSEYNDDEVDLAEAVCCR